jgi:uncharacterized protein YejL (UPF0352 family)
LTAADGGARCRKTAAKYQVEQLLSELVNVLEKHKTPTDLSLMVLGNMVTNLINTSVAPAQRQAIAKSFAQALQSSVNDDPAH